VEAVGLPRSPARLRARSVKTLDALTTLKNSFSQPDVFLEAARHSAAQAGSLLDFVHAALPVSVYFRAGAAREHPGRDGLERVR
jgi:hypothetical protein